MNTVRDHLGLKMLFCAITALAMLTSPPALAEESLPFMPLKGDFDLEDEQGQKVSLKSYRGAYLLVYFGYTYCPDVCPASLGQLSEALWHIPEPKAQRITPLFISVDPQRDNQEHLRIYTDAFHHAMVGLTGSPDNLQQAAKMFGAYYIKGKPEPDDPEDYTISHSSLTYLVGPEGNMLKLFPHATSVKEIAITLDRMIQLPKGE
ncbi:MAG: SCO family protein [Magnetococcales bacterium]|nr:SCO family protein [Magnetococcales bacterium]